MSSNQTQINCKLILQQSTDSSEAKICQVCGDKARCYNYGAISCLSCRAFFRRHGFRSKEIHPCPFDEPCEVHVQKQKRRACVACRLAKCLAVGMNVSFFREVVRKRQKNSPLTKVVNTHTSQVQSLKCVPQLSTLDLLNRNRSNLNFTDWTLLSNVIHAYDNFSSVPVMTRAIEQLSRLSISESFKMPIMLETSEAILTSLVTLLRSMPDFQILTVSQQRSLLSRNITGISCLDFMYVTRQSGCTTNSPFISNYISICGSDAFSRVKRFEYQLDSDSALVKLMVITLAFSSNYSVLTMPEQIHHDTLLLGTFRLLGSQNVYVELLWNYMVYRYGYGETVIRFARLVKQAVDLLGHAAQACTNMNDSRFHLDNVFPEGKRSDMSSSSENVPLWGYV